MDKTFVFDKIKDVPKTSQIMGIIGGAMYIVALFTDAYTGIVPFLGSVTVKLSYYMGNLAFIIWIIGLAAIACSIFKKGIVQGVTGLMGLLFAIFVRVTLESKLNEPTVPTTLDIAPYLLFVGSILVLVAGVLYEFDKRRAKPTSTEVGEQEPTAPKPALTPEQIEERKQLIKKWLIRIVKVAAPLAGLVLVLVLLTYIINTVIPRSHYEKGMEAFETEDYSTAVQEFTKAREYEDAPSMLADAQIALHYQNGVNALNSSDYELANTEFLAAGDYEDAESQAAYAALGIHYSTGVTLLESGDYEAAINEFEEADYFPGSSNRINQSYYEMASEQYDAGDYLSAAENFSLSNGYDDAEERILSMGDESLDSGDYATAASYYQYSSDERYAAYALGMDEMNNGDYNPAVDHFVTADDLFDSADRVNECRYLYGLELLVNRDFSAATAYLQLVSGYRDADVVYLVALAEKANQDRDIVTAVNSYSQVPEDFSMAGFDAQERRAIFTGSEAVAFAEFCSPYEVESIDAYCSSQGRYGTYGGWTLTEIIPDQELSFNCRYEDGTFTLNGHVQFFIFEDYSPIRDLTGFNNESRHFTFEGITSPPSSYEFEDGTTITFSGNQATVHYHSVDNYSVGMNYIYDSVVTFSRE